METREKETAGVFVVFEGAPFEREFEGTSQGWTEALAYRDEVHASAVIATPDNFEEKLREVWMTAPIGTKLIVEPDDDEHGVTFYFERVEDAWVAGDDREEVMPKR